MSALPTGTVTFLFTDIEGSTRLLHDLGANYVGALAEHRRALRAAFVRHGGVEVDTQGDAFFVAFPRASDALAAAEAGQRALADGPLRVRMGLHSGEPLVTEEGYVGLDVHRAARIAAAGHGGQVLVSQSVRDLSGHGALRDLGEHRLKDLTAPERIFQLGREEFPPLKSLNTTNLPVAASPLVGREHELGDLQSLLRDSARLVTLTGPGGTGKTRLALQVAAELVEDFPGGVFFVPLAGVGRADLVASTIASTIGLHDLSELQEREALLLVDNFEHLLDAAPAISSLLAVAPRARVLATSRAPLRVEGEREYALDSLPDDEAVELLTQRARAVRPDFRPDAAALEICRRLDALPLALELAASRLRSLGSSALLERLDRRLPLLTGGRRDAPDRQRTLRATIEWSYDLLPEPLQGAFARLAVFVGTFSVDAAELVSSATLDDVDALVEVSLLKPTGSDRLVMLETIRELALERLDAGGDGEAVRLRHAEFFTELARGANLNQEAEGPMRHDLVIPERNNIRAALEWTIATGRAELGLRLAVALENYWATADSQEGKRWIETLLSLDPGVAGELHAMAVRCLGNSAAIMGEEGAERLYEQSLAEFRALGDELRAATLVHRLANAAAVRGDAERARALLEESLPVFRAHGSRNGEAQSLSLLGRLEQLAGRPARALELYERSLALGRESGFTWWERNVLLSQARTYFSLERPAEAGRCAAEALGVARRIGDRLGKINALMLLTRAVAEQGDGELAGEIWGAIEADLDRAPIAGWKAELSEIEGPPLRWSAGPPFERGRAAGRELSLDDAAAAALEAPMASRAP